MNRVIKAQLVIAVLVVLTCGLASAQNHALQKTYLDTGYYESGLSIPAKTWTAVGPVVDIVCPGTSGTCTIEAIHSIQVAGPGTAGNTVQIDFMLDGKNQVLAQQVGEVPTDGSLRVFSAIEVESNISPGNHTVQTSVWSVDGADVYNYETSYQVYKP